MSNDTERKFLDYSTWSHYAERIDKLRSNICVITKSMESEEEEFSDDLSFFVLDCLQEAAEKMEALSRDFNNL